MRGRRGAILIALAAAAGLVVFLAVRNPQAPLLPPDADHATFAGADGCLVCHGPDGALPRSTNHPIGRECLRCHGLRR